MAISNYSTTRDSNASIAPGDLRSNDYRRDQQIINAIRQLMADLAAVSAGTAGFDRLRINNNTDVSSLTQTDQPVQIGTYDNVNLMIDGNEIQARSNGAATALNLQLLGDVVRIGSNGGSHVLDGTTIYKLADTNSTVISGGSSVSNGAHVELYGGAHSTNPNEAYYDANLHTFRLQNASALNAINVAGIQFPATQIASSDANRLDDYEEGTWTPSWVGSTVAGSFTYSHRQGAYIKVGQSVYWMCGLRVSAISTAPTGNLAITGLPFTPSYSPFSWAGFGSVSYSDISQSGITSWGIIVDGNFPVAATDQFRISGQTAGGGLTTVLAAASLAVDQFFICSGVYRSAS